MAEPLILINGPIDQLSSVLPHITEPAGFQKIPCQKKALSSRLGVKCKGWILSLFFFRAHWWGAEQWTGEKLGICGLQSIFLFWFASSFKVQQFNSQHRPRSRFLHFEFPAKSITRLTSPRGNQSPNSTWHFTRVWRKTSPSHCWSCAEVFGTKTLAQPLKLLSLGPER